MPSTVAYATCLRVVGRCLDQMGAARIMVLISDGAWSISWETSGKPEQERGYRRCTTVELEAEAQLGAGDTPDVRMGYAEMLGALGVACDQEGVEPQGLIESDTGFDLAGLQAGQSWNHAYSAWDMRRLVADARARLVAA